MGNMGSCTSRLGRVYRVGCLGEPPKPTFKEMARIVKHELRDPYLDRKATEPLSHTHRVATRRIKFGEQMRTSFERKAKFARSKKLTQQYEALVHEINRRLVQLNLAMAVESTPTNMPENAQESCELYTDDVCP